MFQFFSDSVSCPSACEPLADCLIVAAIRPHPYGNRNISLRPSPKFVVSLYCTRRGAGNSAFPVSGTLAAPPDQRFLALATRWFVHPPGALGVLGRQYTLVTFPSQNRSRHTSEYILACSHFLTSAITWSLVKGSEQPERTRRIRRRFIF